jgi:uncharacterized protein (TIGR02145 family)
MIFSLRFLFLLILLLSKILSAQTVTGRLVDQNGKSLPGVQLLLYSTPYIDTATSSTDGSFTFTTITEVKDQQLPTGYSVSANYPNPFNPRTRIEITLPNNGNVKVELYNQIGQKVRSDIEKYFTAGNNYIDLELKGLSNGFYIARINVDGRYNVIRKLMLIYGSQHLVTSSLNSVTGNIKTPVDKTGSVIILDSLVATSSIIGRKSFLELPNYTGSPLDLGILTIDRSCPGTSTIMYSGKTYNTIQIGSQCWLKENLDVGTMISSTIDQSNNKIIEKYCYNDSIQNCDKNGGLYQWGEMMQYVNTEGSQGICPDGWHLPLISDFNALISAVKSDANSLKEIGQGTGIGAGTNTSGFSALLSGSWDGNGNFVRLGGSVYFWSTSMYNNWGYAYYLWVDLNEIYDTYFSSANGLSVRCLKNDP